MKECLLKSALVQGPFALIFLSAHGYNCQGVFVIIKRPASKTNSFLQYSGIFSHTQSLDCYAILQP